MSNLGPTIAVAPLDSPEWMREAVVAGGGRIASPMVARGLIWAAPNDPDGLRTVLEVAPNLEWVQLPWAGIEPYVALLDDAHVWSCGKGVYAEPVAEMALSMALAGMRGLVQYGRAKSWSGPRGRNLHHSRVVVVGGGEITKELIRLLEPFGCRITVVRKRRLPMGSTINVVGTENLDETLSRADVVFLALALTDETRGIIGVAQLAAMQSHTWLVNVARGAHIDTDALVDALSTGSIGGAALDVTDPEPLPDGHALWSMDNCLITPHVGNTPEMAVPLLSERIRLNVRRFGKGDNLVGLVDPKLGY